MVDPSSRTVLVTGCSSGIGEATARRLAVGGWTVYATARDPDDVEDLVGVGCRPLQLDVTDEDSMATAVAEVEADEGTVDVLVNNAGYGEYGPVELLDLDAVRQQFETNVFGAIRLSQLVLPGMRRQGWGRIVNVSSMGGTITLPGGGAYHGSKHALEAFSDVLRFEVRPFGVRVIVIQPGPIRTPWRHTANETLVETAEDSPYASFARSLERTTTQLYDSPLAAPPDRVAAAIERAIGRSRPRGRYAVTGTARFMMLSRRLLPDQLWDATLRLSVRQPRPEDG